MKSKIRKNKKLVTMPSSWWRISNERAWSVYSRVFHFSSLKKKSQTDLAYNATIYSKTFAAKIRIFGRNLK